MKSEKYKEKKTEQKNDRIYDKYELGQYVYQQVGDQQKCSDLMFGTKINC